MLRNFPTAIILFVATIFFVRCEGLDCLCSGPVKNNNCINGTHTCDGVCLIVGLSSTNALQPRCHKPIKFDSMSYLECKQISSTLVGSNKCMFCCVQNNCNTMEAYNQWRLSGVPCLNPSASSISTISTSSVTASAIDLSHTNTVNSTLDTDTGNASPPPYAIAIIVVLSLVITIVITVIALILSWYCYSCYPGNHKQSTKKPGRASSISAVSSVDLTVSTVDCSAGSDAGLPVLVQSHIARQIVRGDLIGRGRYGQVWRGYYKGEDVAVKVFLSVEQNSWLHEVDIYQKCILRHPNILRFIAADRSDAGISIELWLIAEFCEHGNLYDYLQCYALDENTVVAMAHDIASGLVFIHSEITGTQGKPAMAHRDIKSRNILVKKDLSLCIGDFGLAVRHKLSTDSIEELPKKQVGTKRYLAPEILDETMSTMIFDCFKRADIYSFSLVLWEIVCRGQCNGLVEEPQLPYYDHVQSDPSLEEMHKTVCVNQHRPVIPNRWHQTPIFNGLAKLMTECWHSNGAARLTALRVRRRLEDLLHKNNTKKVSTSS